VLRLKAVQPQNQPLRGERGRGGDGKRAGVVVRAQPAHRGLDAGERLGEARQQYARRGGQLDLPVEAAEQLHAEIGFERVDLMADRGRGHVELGGGLAEALQPGRGLERAQGAERRQVTVHSDELFSTSTEKVSFVR
jgi:hypothetical protein